MAKILPVPPAFPMPVLPQSFDMSLSYYELLCNLMNAINTAIQQINENTGNIETLQTAINGLSVNLTEMQTAIDDLQTQIDGLPAQVQTVSDALQQEIADRTDADESLALQIAGVKNLVQTFYVSFEDLEGDYLCGGITFQLLTQAEFDALEAAGQLIAKRVYFIDTGSNIIIRYHYASGENPVMNAQATGLFSFAFGNRGQSITGVFTPDE